jgi:hypothetical protein
LRVETIVEILHWLVNRPLDDGKMSSPEQRDVIMLPPPVPPNSPSKSMAIVGSRTFKDYKLLRSTIVSNPALNGCDTVISGGAHGADLLGERFARERGLQVLRIVPDWKTHNRYAGLMRNTDIVNRADHVIAFWDGVSTGTKDTIAKAKRAGKLVQVVEFTKDQD